jgi:hypothetical protein
MTKNNFVMKNPLILRTRMHVRYSNSNVTLGKKEKWCAYFTHDGY